MRDGDGHVYRFPTTVLRAGASVILHTGSGRNRPGHRYWGRTGHVWDNTGTERASLRDRYGRLVDTCSWRGTSRGTTTC
jgi:hypothetical protein